MEFNSRVYFHLGLYLLLNLIENAPFRLTQEKAIIQTIKASKPLVYAVLVYYSLKSATSADMLLFNPSLTFCALITTVVKYTLEYLSPVYELRVEGLYLRSLQYRTWHKKLSIFPSCLLARANFIL